MLHHVRQKAWYDKVQIHKVHVLNSSAVNDLSFFVELIKNIDPILINLITSY